MCTLTYSHQHAHKDIILTMPSPHERRAEAVCFCASLKILLISKHTFSNLSFCFAIMAVLIAELTFNYTEVIFLLNVKV